MQYFPETKPAAIEETENFGHNEVAQRGASRRIERIHGLKELSNLFMSQNSWCKTRWISSSQCGIGHIRTITKPQQEPGELANDHEPLLLGSRTFVRPLGQPFLGDGSR